MKFRFFSWAGLLFEYPRYTQLATFLFISPFFIHFRTFSRIVERFRFDREASAPRINRDEHLSLACREHSDE